MNLINCMKEKGFLKISLTKNYITDEKEITYYYPTMDDYNWHKQRLSKSNWSLVELKNKYAVLDGREVRVLKAIYTKKSKKQEVKK